MQLKTVNRKTTSFGTLYDREAYNPQVLGLMESLRSDWCAAFQAGDQIHLGGYER